MNYSTEGYRDNSPDKTNPMNIIPSNIISMKGVSRPITAIPIIKGKPDYSKKQILQPEQDDFIFEGAEAVLELPFAQSEYGLITNGFLPNFNFGTSVIPQTTQPLDNPLFPNQIIGRDTSVDFQNLGQRINNPQDLSNVSPQSRIGRIWAQNTQKIPTNFSFNDITTYSEVDPNNLNPENTTGQGTITTDWQNITNQINQENKKIKEQQNQNTNNYFTSLFNNVGATRDLSSSLTRAGYGFGFNVNDYDWASPQAKNTARTGNTLATIGAVGNSLLKGAKDFMSGMAAANREQQAVNEYQEMMSENLRNRNNYYLKDGGQIQDEMILTGNYTTGLPQNSPIIPSAETEQGEYIQLPNGQVQEVLGDKHSQGGELMDLPTGTKVITDYIKIGGELSRRLNKEYELNTSASNTYATVLDKYKKKIGLNSILEEEQKTIGKIKDQEDVDHNETRELNLSVLSKKIENLQQEKAPLDQQMQTFTNYLFEEQEKNKTKEAEKNTYKKGGLKLLQEGGKISAEDIQSIIQTYAELSGLPYEQIIQQFSQLTPEQQEQALQQMVAEMQSLEQNNVQQEFKKGGEVKNKWISEKISLLAKEDPKRSNDQNIAIAFSIWENRKHQANPNGTIVNDRDIRYLNTNQNRPFAVYNPIAVSEYPLQHLNPQTGAYDDVNTQFTLDWYRNNIPYVINDFIQTNDENVSFRNDIENPILGFQQGYNNYVDDTSKLFQSEYGYSPNDIKEYAEAIRFNPEWQYGQTSRGLDNKYGQFTSTRSAFQRPIVTPEQLKKLNDVGVYTARQALQQEPEKAKEILGEDTYKKVVKGLDEYKNADYTIGIIQEETPNQTNSDNSTQGSTTRPYEGQNSVNQLSLPWSEINQTIPFPMGLEFGRLQSVSPININPVNISPEPQLNELNRQVAFANSQINFTPDATRAAQLANIISTSADASNEAIATTNLQNAQMNQQVEQYNENQVGAADRMNTELAENYSDRYLRTRAALESQQLGWYNYMNQLAGQQAQRQFTSNVANALFPNFQLSSDGRLVARPGYYDPIVSNQPVQTLKEGGTIKSFLEEKMFKNNTKKA